MAACALGHALHAPSEARAEPSPHQLIEDLARSLVLVENEYVDAVPRERLLAGAVRGMVAELDPHSEYLPQSDFALLKQETEGQFAGVGVEVDFGNDRVTVLAVLPGGPAEAAGVKRGDVVVSIEGRSTLDRSMGDLIKSVRGPVGTWVHFQIRRKGLDQLLDFRVLREPVAVQSVVHKTLENGVLYVQLRQFSELSHEQLLQAVAQARSAAPVRGLILDLRNNPGGLISAAIGIADEFLQSGTLFTTRHRGRVVERVSASPRGLLLEMPLVTLVNEFSASASELLAGALQDHERSPIVGSRTFGKGSVQSIFALPGGAGMKLTTMRYFTPGGSAIQARGVKPDVSVPSDFPPGGRWEVLRESDLAGHISAQPPRALPPAQAEAAPSGLSPTDNAANQARGVCRPVKEFDPEAPLFRGVALDPQGDPRQAQDRGLAAAYRALLAKLDAPHPPSRATP